MCARPSHAAFSPSSHAGERRVRGHSPPPVILDVSNRGSSVFIFSFKLALNPKGPILCGRTMRAVLRFVIAMRPSGRKARQSTPAVRGVTARETASNK